MNRTPATFPALLAERLGLAAQAPPELTARVQAALGNHAFATVISPPDAAAVAQALAACSEEGWPVLPAGAATWLRRRRGVGQARLADPRAGADQRPPVVISTSRLHAVLEHEPADLVIGVQAGAPIDAVHQTLARKKQWLPLDPPAAGTASIGAVAALGSAGPLRAAHGTPRDMVLGLEIATGDGRLIRFGGRVVKNVAGYDGVRLSVGSAGRLGIITALYLRVRGTPRSDRTLAIACGRGEDGMRRGVDTAGALRDAIDCDALELLSPATAAHLGAGSGGDWLLLVRIIGNVAAVDEGIERVRGIAATASELPAGTWPALGRLETDAKVSVRLAGSATTLDNGLAQAATIQGRAGQPQEWMTAAHAADGIVRLWSPHEGAALSPSGIGACMRDATAHGWSLQFDIEAGSDAGDRSNDPGSGEAAGPITGGDPIRQGLEDRLRSVFDPAGILPAAAGAP